LSGCRAALESYSRRVDNLLNNERPNELWGQPLALLPQWKVLGGEPHLLAHQVNGVRERWWLAAVEYRSTTCRRAALAWVQVWRQRRMKALTDGQEASFFAARSCGHTGRGRVLRWSWLGCCGHILPTTAVWTKLRNV